MILKNYLKEETDSFGLKDMNGYKVVVISKLSRLKDLPIFISKVFEDEKVICLDMRPYEANYKTTPTSLDELVLKSSEWKLPIIHGYINTLKAQYPTSILELAQLAFIKPTVDRLVLNSSDASVVAECFLYPMAKQLTDEPIRLIATSMLYPFGSDIAMKIEREYGEDGYGKFNTVLKTIENTTYRLRNLQLSDILQFSSVSVFRQHITLLQTSINTPKNLLVLGVLYTDAIKYKRARLYNELFTKNKKLDLSEPIESLAIEIDDYIKVD